MFHQPNRLDIDVHRNATFLQEFTLYGDDDEVVDITDAVLTSTARSHAGADAITSADVSVSDGPAGKFTFQWDGDDFASFGSLTEPVVAVYDLKMVLDGTPYILAYGVLNILPGITT